MFVIATSKEKSLNPLISKSHLFGKYVALQSPDKVRRIAILEGLLRGQGNGLPLEDIVSRMEGYSVGDMEAFTRQTVENSIIRAIENNSEKSIEMQDFDQTFQSFKPLASSKARLDSSEVKWSSVGGMKQAKKMLVETLKWPTIYPQIFKASPLRLRSGILLYGYPGCGKTMLGSAVAKECGLNFISVKGPELLNKYIGASEKSVRDVFERAKSAKPCILFFDEFDSIAPRRGVDNSGVTDRVVNQLLTEMDGAEGLEGVYVLAATSRPDLIDPALLRPGRLDKAILCDMPSLEDRTEIIEAVSISIPIDPLISFQEIAERTDGFTGADLQGLLYTAQLDAIHDRMSKLEIPSTIKEDTSTEISFQVIQGEISEINIQDRIRELKEQSTSKQEASRVRQEPVVVKDTNLRKALQTTRSSILVEERFRLENLFARFAGKDATPEVVGKRIVHA